MVTVRRWEYADCSHVARRSRDTIPILEAKHFSLRITIQPLYFNRANHVMTLALVKIGQKTRESSQ
jgi:hypothetical protein